MKLTIDTIIELTKAADLIFSVVPSQDQENVLKDLEILLSDPRARVAFTTGLYRLRANMQVLKQCEVLIFSQQPPKGVADRVTEVVAQEYALRSSDLRSKSRRKSIAEARHMAMWMLRQITKMSLQDIGAAFKRECHTTVISGISRIEKDTDLRIHGFNLIDRLRNQETKP